MPPIARFINAQLCIKGQLVDKTLYVDTETGFIVNDPQNGEFEQTFDLQGHILAPAYLELQTNGCKGFHFTNFRSSEQYQHSLTKAARYLASTGVGSFWATVPTVSSRVFHQVLRELKPKSFDGGADLLGAHCEGPCLNPAKKGAHNSSLMLLPSQFDPASVYGETNLTTIKHVTLAPELDGAMDLVSKLTYYHGYAVSLGHSSGSYEAGYFAITCGARSLTHVFNAMSPLNHREPGLVGLIASNCSPFYSIIPDGIHLHPATASLAYRANPARCILITDSIELAGLPDGTYPGHAQVPLNQYKKGNKVTISGTDTLIGSCISLDECVRNMMKFARCGIAEAVRCVTENVAEMMKLNDRGLLEPGRRADLTILDPAGNVKEVWIRGRCTYRNGKSDDEMEL